MNKYQYKVQGVDYDVEIEEVEDSKNVEIVNPVKNKKDPYWDFIKVKLTTTPKRTVNKNTLFTLKIFFILLRFIIIFLTTTTYTNCRKRERIINQYFTFPSATAFK